jgi:hypothetical protein
MTTKISVPLIIRHDQDDIWLLRKACRRSDKDDEVKKQLGE